MNRVNHELAELRIEKARECSSLQQMIDELKTQLDENSKEVNKLKRELGVKANEATTLVKLNEEMKEINHKLNQSKLEIQQLRSEELSRLQRELEVVKLENGKLKRDLIETKSSNVESHQSTLSHILF